MTLQEIKAIIEVRRKEENRRNRFAAAIQGINMDGGDETDEERFDRVRRNAAAQLAGKSEEELVLDELGFGVETG